MAYSRNQSPSSTLAFTSRGAQPRCFHPRHHRFNIFISVHLLFATSSLVLFQQHRVSHRSKPPISVPSAKLSVPCSCCFNWDRRFALNVAPNAARCKSKCMRFAILRSPSNGCTSRTPRCVNGTIFGDAQPPGLTLIGT
eukprot:49470-Rhodomonas_salina.1